MTEVVKIGNAELHMGDCLDVLRTLPDASIEAIVTDPPYGLAFMGKKWDYDVPAVEVWQECLRVLKPGGHLLAFSGTRTFHRMAVRIEDAGFEIRDMIAWVYGSGFPKSLDVSKAIDKMDAVEEQERRRLRFTAWVRSTGVTSRQIDQATGTNMGGHYITAASQPAIMTREHLEACRHLLGDVPEWVEREADIRSVEIRNMAEREVVGHSDRGFAPGTNAVYGDYSGDTRITAPATAAARQWQGWGTALKPALEPITVARKPLDGTVAENVLRHGTGGINVDGCRVGTREKEKFTDAKRVSAFGGNAQDYKNPRHYGRATTPLPPGRWPANLIHDGSDEVEGLFPESKGQQSAVRGTEPSKMVDANCYGEYERVPFAARGDTGSAARFFYCAKASKADRDEGCDGLPQHDTSLKYNGGDGFAGRTQVDGEWVNTDKANRVKPRNHHPTVKPTALMSYLCRLITPPGGTILDPFMGSGSTGKAAMREGFRFIGIEREAEYLAIAQSRISATQRQPDLFHKEAA